MTSEWIKFTCQDVLALKWLLVCQRKMTYHKREITHTCKISVEFTLLGLGGWLNG